MPDASEAENLAIYGKCNNPHGHGHNYTIEVTLSGQVSEKTGMVCDLAVLDQFTHQNVLEGLDHTNLNCVEAFAGEVPTTERLCMHVFDLYKRGLQAAKLERVRIEETAKNSFEYTG